ncbi:hypothetical protein ACVIM8_001817 [Bradyrhizobium sp. USDA 4529]
MQEKLPNARRAYHRLTLVSEPAEGALTVVKSVADAVQRGACAGVGARAYRSGEVRFAR